MVAADLNRDGKLDLVGRLIRLGKGNGTFQSGVPSGLGEDFAALAVSDFNGDGKPDVATIISDRPFGVAPVRVYLGNDDGSLRWAGGYSANTDPVAIEVRDFNGDSRPDLAVANRGSRGQSVSVLLGSGDGTFQGAVSFDVKPPISLAGGDFNGDGKPDLVVGHLDSSNVSVWLNKGDGSFSAAAEYRAALNPFSLAVGDLNGDGRLDLAVGNKGNYLDDGCVSILLGKGDGTFAAAVNYAEGTEPAAVAFGDFNGDGKPDLAVAISGSHTVYWFHDSVRVLLGNGDGTFQAPAAFAVGNIPISLALGDFNADGKPDIVVSQMSGASLLLNTCGSAQLVDFAFFQRAEGLILSWPVSSMGFALESATNLTRWLPALEVPTATNGRWTIRVPVNQGERFFRLRQP